MAKTINQARAAFKRYFKTEASAELSVEDIDKKLSDARALAEAAKLPKQPAQNSGSKGTPSPAKKCEYKATFHKVEIPKMGIFTAEELEANPEVCEYLLEIGSPAVVKL